MRYRVYGLEIISKAPRGPLVVEADSEGAAPALAREQGMQAELVEPVDMPIPPYDDPRLPDSPRLPAAEPVTSRDQLRRLGEQLRRSVGWLRHTGSVCWSSAAWRLCSAWQSGSTPSLGRDQIAARRHSFGGGSHAIGGEGHRPTSGLHPHVDAPTMTAGFHSRRFGRPCKAPRARATIRLDHKTPLVPFARHFSW